jgi:hypothetical protein
VHQVGVAAGPADQETGQVTESDAVRDGPLVGHRHSDGEDAGPHRVLVHRDPDPDAVGPLGGDRGSSGEGPAGEAGGDVLLGHDLRREDAGHRLQHHLLEVDQVERDVGPDRPGDALQHVRDVLRVRLAQAVHHGSDVDHAQR